MKRTVAVCFLPALGWMIPVPSFASYETCGAPLPEVEEIIRKPARCNLHRRGAICPQGATHRRILRRKIELIFLIIFYDDLTKKKIKRKSISSPTRVLRLVQAPRLVFAFPGL